MSAAAFVFLILIYHFESMHIPLYTVLNPIQRIEKIISILKKASFSGKGRQSLI